MLIGAGALLWYSKGVYPELSSVIYITKFFFSVIDKNP